MRSKTVLTLLPTASGMLLLVLTLALVVVKTNKSSAVSLRVSASNQDVSLAFTPKSQTYNFSPNSFYTSGIILDSGGKTINGADVLIHFDPLIVIFVKHE